MSISIRSSVKFYSINVTSQVVDTCTIALPSHLIIVGCNKVVKTQEYVIERDRECCTTLQKVTCPHNDVREGSIFKVL